MTTMAPPRRPNGTGSVARLATGPAAAAEARRRVRAAIRSWPVPVEQDVALLLTSELVTNAVRHEPGQAVMLVISCSSGRLRVDVHDTSRSLPAVADVPADAETGRGLLLVETLSDEWGFYRTPAGKAVYFTLVFGAEPGSRGRRTRPAAGSRAGTVDRDSSLGTPSSPRRPRRPRRAPAFGLRHPAFGPRRTAPQPDAPASDAGPPARRSPILGACALKNPKDPKAPTAMSRSSGAATRWPNSSAASTCATSRSSPARATAGCTTAW